MITSIIAFIFITVPTLLITFVIVAIVKNSKMNKGESLERAIRVIYMYLVLLVALAMVVGGSIAYFSSLMDYIFPNYYSSYYSSSRIAIDMIAEITVVVIGLPLFIYHNKKIKELKN